MLAIFKDLCRTGLAVTNVKLGIVGGEQIFWGAKKTPDYKSPALDRKSSRS